MPALLADFRRPPRLSLLKLLDTGSTVEEIRDLIAVPAPIEEALRAFARAHPEEAHFIDRALMFRQTVLEEFNRLVCVGIPEDPAEIEETESEEMVLLA
jgi:hypothetical protein